MGSCVLLHALSICVDACFPPIHACIPAVLQDAMRDADSYLFDLDHFIQVCVWVGGEGVVRSRTERHQRPALSSVCGTQAGPGCPRPPTAAPFSVQVNYDRCTREEERARLPPLPPCITDDNSNHLTVDAQRVGERTSPKSTHRACCLPACSRGTSSHLKQGPWPPAIAPSLPPCAAPPAGNIARFINHSCSPNLVAQAVLRPGDSGLRYGIAFVASW